jgi:hypothetical protein
MILKYFFTLLIALTFSTVAKADQLEILTLEQAVAATEYLQSEEMVFLWCACCEGEEPRAVLITEVNYQSVGENQYSVYIKGVDTEGNEINEYIDLAYVHVVIENMVYCLGTTLGYECDPCVDPFSMEE